MNKNQKKSKNIEIYKLSNSITKDFSELIDFYSMELVKHLETKGKEEQKKRMGDETSRIDFFGTIFIAPFIGLFLAILTIVYTIDYLKSIRLISMSSQSFYAYDLFVLALFLTYIY